MSNTITITFKGSSDDIAGCYWARGDVDDDDCASGSLRVFRVRHGGDVMSGQWPPKDPNVAIVVRAMFDIRTNDVETIRAQDALGIRGDVLNLRSLEAVVAAAEAYRKSDEYERS
jgi:hypothetical protein